MVRLVAPFLNFIQRNSKEQLEQWSKKQQFFYEIIHLPLHTVGHASDERPENSWNHPQLKQVHHVSGRCQRNSKGIVTKVYPEKSIVAKVS